MPRRRSALKKYRKKRPAAKSIASVVKRVISRQAETKLIDATMNLAPVAGSMVTSLYNNVGQGIQDYERIGNEIKAKWLLIKGSITFPDTTNRLRLLVVLDKQPNGVAPAVADLFTFSGNPVSSFYNPDSRGRFKILKDRVFAGGSQGPVAVPFDMRVKLGFKTVYSSGGIGIADIRTNALWVIAVSDSLAIPHPLADGAVRFLYSDM